MYVITFANPKGGSGKTTSAMLLAEQIAIAGGTVGVLDCDPNQNIVQWAQMRQDEGRGAPFTIQPVPTEDEFLDAVDAFRGKVDYLIIDLEGTASQMVTYAISQSDLVLVPFEPTPMEARQAARAVQLARNVGRMANRNIPHALLLTRVNAAFQTSDEKEDRHERVVDPVVEGLIDRDRTDLDDSVGMPEVGDKLGGRRVRQDQGDDRGKDEEDTAR